LSDQGLSAIRAAAARHALVLDNLAIKVVLRLDNAANEHPAVHAGVGALEAGVVCLYGIVLILSGWVRVGCARLCGVHRAPSLWAGLRGVGSTAGANSLSNAFIIQQLSVFCLVIYSNCLYNLRMKYGVCTTPDMEVNVERLRALRIEHVLTLRELAQAAGVSKDTIWRLENGHSEAHPSTIRKLAKTLGVQPKELVKTGGSDG
jgi:DNA-binding XRE family transcriptional regulator